MFHRRRYEVGRGRVGVFAVIPRGVCVPKRSGSSLILPRSTRRREKKSLGGVPQLTPRTSVAVPVRSLTVTPPFHSRGAPNQLHVLLAAGLRADFVYVGPSDRRKKRSIPDAGREWWHAGGFPGERCARMTKIRRSSSAAPHFRAAFFASSELFLRVSFKLSAYH